MTMQNDSHPNDERLAAYSAGDADVLGDRALAEHLTACDRCRPIVDDLTRLRGALAALPDLAPSRPLRLIPPAPEPIAPRAGRFEWLRRLAAPAMAAGAGLVLVGAIGASGVLNELTTKSTDRAVEAASASDAAKGPVAGGAGSLAPVPMTSFDSGGLFGRSDAPRTETDGVDDSTQATPSTAEQVFPLSNTPSTPSNEQPWLTLLVAGAGLFGVSAAVRYSLSPRAG